MFVDQNQWPPAPGGGPPRSEPVRPGAGERAALRAAGALLLAVIVAPFAGGSVLEALFTVIRRLLQG